MKIPIVYEKSNIYLSMAGSGDPWIYFKPSSKLTLRALHDSYSFNEIQKMFEVTEEELSEKIELLITGNLIRKEGNNYYPTFLIVDKNEAEETFLTAKSIGRIIADELAENWDEILNDFNQLEISEKYTIDELSFVLIGSKILDIGLLEAFVKDGSLLVSAPSRPNPETPDAKYYFFMIDGRPEFLGKYGENEIDLPWDNWTLVAFGQNTINGKPNKPREELIEKCSLMLKKYTIEKPEELALKLKIPIISQEDSLAWKETTRKIATRIFLKIKEKEKELLQFYKNLKVSKYTNNTLGEFFCWYVHIAYAWAIDFLIEEKKIYFPEEKFGALLFYIKGPQGLLVK